MAFADPVARYNGTAPIEALQRPPLWHRLNPRGTRQLNHALHIVAVTQVRYDTPGRTSYLHKHTRLGLLSPRQAARPGSA